MKRVLSCLLVLAAVAPMGVSAQDQGRPAFISFDGGACVDCNSSDLGGLCPCQILPPIYVE